MNRLALAMGDPNIGRHLSAKRFAEWLWAEQVEPFGQLREDYRAAQIVGMIHNTVVSKEDQKKVEDFLLKFQEAKSQKQTVDEQIMILNIMAAAFSGG